MTALSITLSLLNPGMTAYADSVSDSTKTMEEFAEVERDNLLVDDIEEVASNIMERNYSGEQYTISAGIEEHSENEDSVTNTDPNYALVVNNDTVMQGNIEAANEMRWYGFILNQKSTVTILLNTVETLDADIYLFALNQETYELELIGGCAAEGQGLSEYFRHVMEPGVYYFAVAGYESTGGFAFGYYESNIDVDYEVNDSMDAAPEITFDKKITGVIDGPNDVDFYKLTVSKRTILKNMNSIPGEYTFQCVSTTGGRFDALTEHQNWCDIRPGTYYLAVYSKNNSYSATKTYTICLEKVETLCNDPTADFIAFYEDAGFFFQTNESGTANYVNGNPVDISYNYHFESSNATGMQNYNISIDPNAGAHVYIDWEHGNYYPGAIHYHTSTHPAMKVSGRPALLLTYVGSSEFYKINCRGTGAYAQHTLKREDSEIIVIIDPSTGKLIDIFEFNFFYHHNTSPGNKIVTAGPYKSQKLEKLGN